MSESTDAVIAPEVRVDGWSGLHGPAARSFTQVWDRRARQEFAGHSRSEGHLQAASGRAGHRWDDKRLWLNDIVRGDIPDLTHELLPVVLDVVTRTAFDSAAAGHRIDRMIATISPQVHRLLCQTHVGPASSSGWPLWCGVTVMDAGVPRVPDRWDRRSLAVDPNLDQLTIRALRHAPPIISEHVPPVSVPTEGQQIYRTLRHDGMPTSEAAVAARLLAGS